MGEDKTPFVGRVAIVLPLLLSSIIIIDLVSCFSGITKIIRFLRLKPIKIGNLKKVRPSPIGAKNLMSSTIGRKDKKRFLLTNKDANCMKEHDDDRKEGKRSDRPTPSICSP